ncbi:MAG TPA: hypothetical protein VIM37_03635 [Candidatus Microsaccharimonas sp.]|jgi:MFS family permease
MNKNKQLSVRLKDSTIIFGYGIFALTILNVIISTVIPWISLIITPHILVFNASVFLIALVAGAILPILISYILGDRATHVKNKTSHHFNGVLFGVAAYWVSVFFTMSGPYTTPFVHEHVTNVILSAIVNAWPILATTIIMVFVAVSYARYQNKKVSVLEHKPYQLVLFGAVLANVVYMIINQLFSSPESLPISIVYIVAIVILFAISYVALRKVQSSRLMSALLATVALTMAFAALSVAAQLVFTVFTTGDFLIPMMVAGGFGLIVWISYLFLLTRK